MRPLLSLLLAISLIFGGTPVSAAEAVRWEDMQYVHYDAGAFFTDAATLSQLAAGSDAQAVTALYDELYDQFAQMDAYNAVAYVHASADVTDEYWSAESQYSENLRYEMADALSTACYGVTQGPCAAAFAEHVGQRAYDAFTEYVPMTDREAELLARESELVDQYHVLINGADQVEYDYLGEAWTYEKLNGFQGMSLASQDYNGYLEVFYGLQDAVVQQVGPIFQQLVRLRCEIASIEGADSYAALAYEDVYGRDYTPDQAQALCDAVKPVAVQFMQQLGGSSLLYDAEAVLPALSPDDILQLVGEYTARMDPVLAEPFRFMTENGLYDLAGGEDRFPGSYTITLGKYDSAFIFANPDSGYGGLSTLFHEFGHFASDYFVPIDNLVTDVPCYDLLEIHSTGLDTLMTCYYDEIFTDGADTARFKALANGCIFDEFQRRVYEQPDMSLEQMSRLFASISAEYGKVGIRDTDGSWVYVSHTFENPFYYLSYAASSLAAIQLWDMAQTDMHTAVTAWHQLLMTDTCSVSYMTALPLCGLRLFTEPGAVEQICRPLMEELTRLDAGE